MATLSDIGTGGVFFWTSDGGTTTDATENSSANAKWVLRLIMENIYFDAQGNYTSNYEFWVAPSDSWSDARKFESYATLTGLSSAEEITTLLEPRHNVRTEQISSGELSWTRSNALTFVRVQTQSLDPTDDLDTLTVTNVEDGDIVVLVPDDPADVVTVTENDNIDVLEGSTFAMGDEGKAVWLYWDSAASDWKEFNRNSGTRDTDTKSLGTGGGTTNLDPATDSEYQIITGSGTLTASHTIQLNPTKTPQDGHRFTVDYRATFTPDGNNVTIFGLSLTDEQISSGTTIVIATYDSATSAYRARLLQDFSDTAFVESSMVKSLDGAKLDSSSVPDSALSGGPFEPELENYDENPSSPSSQTVSGNNATVIGSGNTASGAESHAVGDGNTASGAESMSFGKGNTSSGDQSTTVGSGNTASGQFSVAAGDQNEATAEKSQARGGFASATRYGEIAGASGAFGSVKGSAQNSEVIYRLATTDATKSEAFLDGSSERFVLETDSAIGFKGRVIATQTGGSSGSEGDLHHFTFEGTIKNVGGTTSLESSVSTTTIDNTAAASGWVVDVTADNSNNSLKIEVTGESNKDIQWTIIVEFAETRW